MKNQIKKFFDMIKEANTVSEFLDMFFKSPVAACVFLPFLFLLANKWLVQDFKVKVIECGTAEMSARANTVQAMSTLGTEFIVAGIVSCVAYVTLAVMLSLILDLFVVVIPRAMKHAPETTNEYERIKVSMRPNSLRMRFYKDLCMLALSSEAFWTWAIFLVTFGFATIVGFQARSSIAHCLTGNDLYNATANIVLSCFICVFLASALFIKFIVRIDAFSAKESNLIIKDIFNNSSSDDLFRFSFAVMSKYGNVTKTILQLSDNKNLIVERTIRSYCIEYAITFDVHSIDSGKDRFTKYNIGEVTVDLASKMFVTAKVYIPGKTVLKKSVLFNLSKHNSMKQITDTVESFIKHDILSLKELGGDK
jgi:hypothetical protein